MTDTCSSVNIPTYPVGNSCVRDDGNRRRLIHNSANVNQLQMDHLNRYEAVFNELMTGQSNGFEKHQKINCLLNSLLNDIRINYGEFNQDLDSIEAQLVSERNHLQQQENVLRTNENSELVTKYRNESSDKRNKQMTTQFTIYVTMIVIFLIVQGIVFFV